MKRNLILTVGLCLLFIASSYADISFRNYTLDKARGVAKIEKRNILVSYSADWCLPCKLLEEGAFQDVRLSTFMNKEFVNIKAHYEDAQDKEWFSKYNVEDLPVILILNHKGEVLYRLQGLMTTEILYNTFQQFQDGGYPVNPIDYQAAYIKKHKITNLSQINEQKRVGQKDKELVNEQNTFIQFARETTLKKAQKKLKKLSKKNIEAIIVEEYLNGNLTYAVINDKPMSFGEASEAFKTYMSQKVGCFIKHEKVYNADLTAK